MRPKKNKRAKKTGNALLKKVEARAILETGLKKIPVDGKRVLVLTPDCTRSGPMPFLFHEMSELLLPRVARIDFLIALGTHRPMTRAAQNSLFGITDKDRKGKYAQVGIYNHDWQKPENLKKIGTIPAAEMEKLSSGLMRQDVTVALNKLLFDYDHLIICGPVFPHEVAGFSGGHKYLSPGVAGPDIINFTHWLGALITSFAIIGKADTPVRAVVERAAAMVKVPMSSVSSVVEGESGLFGLFVGPVYATWKKAAALSSRMHVKWVDKPYKLVISVIPPMYDDMWTGAKGMYKVEPVVADGGEVIIYAPHIKEISFTHGKVLDQIGYHCRDYFVKQWDAVKHFPGGVLAHSTHLKGLGTFEDGVEKTRIKVTLATAIPKERCEKLNLGYRDPKTINPRDYEGKESQGILVLWRAGEVLYRLKSQREG